MDKYAVLGNPIAHSRSPYIHTEFAKSCNQDLIYDKLLCPLDDFKKTVDTFKNSSGKGLNITVPFKEQAYNYATVLTDRANKAGAVNTLKFCDDGSIIGDNTDGAGFIWDLDRLGWSLKGKKVLLLGAGGASRGIIGPIIERLPSSVLLVNRTISKALSIKDIFPSIMVCSYDDLNDANTTFDYIVNCTSLSISGQVPPITSKLINVNTKIYDLMYSSKPTAFLEWGKNSGVKCYSDGLGMLVGQAAVSFELWRGVMPNATQVINLMRDAL
jgi:shikimate dehydrogenase